MKHCSLFFFCLLGVMRVSDAGVTIDGGFTEVALGGSTTIQIPIRILGDDPITDMVGAVEIAGASITAVSYAGSIWESAPGGKIDFYPGFSPPGPVIDPNLSLLAPGESVAANGILFTLTVDISGLEAGDHAVTLSGTSVGGDTEVYLNGVAPATTVTNGLLRIVAKPIGLWREIHFPAELGNAALEATVWGDDADPDADGLKNLAEFAMGLDPNDPLLPIPDATRPGVPRAVIVNDAGQDYLALQFSRRVNRPCHEVAVEFSSNLQSWDDTPAATLEVGMPTVLPGGELELVTRRLTEAIASPGSPSFLRLRVTSLNP